MTGPTRIRAARRKAVALTEPPIQRRLSAPEGALGRPGGDSPPRATMRGRSMRPLPQLNRISVETLNERAYAELRNAIMAARLVPGEAISLRGLAKVLGTSVQPIRDAVKRLMSEKALEALPNRTVRVPHLSVERFMDLCRVRMLLEGEAAALAAQKIRREDIARLERLNADMRAALAARDLTAVFQDNQEFHFTIYRAAENDILLPIIENLWLLAGPYLTVPLRQAPKKHPLYERLTLEHHTTLIGALRARKAPVARKAVESDIHSTAEMVLSVGALAHDEAARAHLLAEDALEQR